MTTKTFEIRDTGTFIAVLAIRLDPADDRDLFLLARAGFTANAKTQADYVILAPLTDLGKTSSDPFGHGTPARTYRVAHEHIIEHFDVLENGAVIDVQFILGETMTPKQTESGSLRGYLHGER